MKGIPKRILSPEEILKIIKAVENIREKSMIALTYFCGLRPIELFTISHEDICHRSRSVRIFSGKTGYWRIIPIHPIAYASLVLFLNTNPEQEKIFCFSKYKSEGLSTYLSKTLKYYANQTNIPNIETITSYSLRHSFATHLLEQEIPIATLSTILGHKDPKTTLMYYTHLSTNIKRKAILQALPPKDLKFQECIEITRGKEC